MSGAYGTWGKNIHALVFQDGELWWARVYVMGEEVYKSQWSGREAALQNGWDAMKRACHQRRFEEVPPELPGAATVTWDEDEDEDDDNE